MASVEIQTPDGVLRVRLDRDHFTIGRLTNNDISLPYSHISRRHAELRLQGQTWWVVDLHSTNGLHVGGRRVGECRLAPGASIMLSPLISIVLMDEAAGPAYPQSPAYPQPQMAPAAQHVAPVAAAYPQPQPQPQLQPQLQPQPMVIASRPSTPMYPSPPSREQFTPLSALGPHSPYADDETPFYPQMRPTSQPRTSHPAYAPSAPVGVFAHPAQYAPAPASGPYVPAPAPAPADAYSGTLDPQRQPAHVFEQRRTAGAAPSPLLHVCQTCGQRTMPDAVYCQNCHHSIATECVRCRLSLLPIQDLCPRCQTPNPASARRNRRTVGPA